MHAILGLGATAFLLCLLLTPICRDLFLRLNIVDHPDADRKLHLTPIPRIGGIPIDGDAPMPPPSDRPRTG